MEDELRAVALARRALQDLLEPFFSRRRRRAPSVSWARAGPPRAGSNWRQLAALHREASVGRPTSAGRFDSPCWAAPTSRECVRQNRQRRQRAQDALTPGISMRGSSASGGNGNNGSNGASKAGGEGRRQDGHHARNLQALPMTRPGARLQKLPPPWHAVTGCCTGTAASPRGR
jgi:hypothetical protein